MSNVETFNAFTGVANLLIDGDREKFSFKEEKLIDDFCMKNNFFLSQGHFSMNSQEVWLGTCEITGLQAVLYEFEFVRTT